MSLYSAGRRPAQLAQVAASGRDVPCALAPVVSEAEPLLIAETPPGEATMATETATRVPGQLPRSPSVATAGASPGKTIPTRSPNTDHRPTSAGCGPGSGPWSPASCCSHRWRPCWCLAARPSAT